MADTIDEMEDLLADATLPAPTPPAVYQSPEGAEELDDLTAEYFPETEIQKSRVGGELHQLKCKTVFEAKALPALFHAFEDANCSYKDKIEVAKLLAEVGNLKPRAQTVAAGPGFSLSIVIPQNVMPSAASGAVGAMETKLTFGGVTLDLPSDSFSGGLDD